MNHLILGLLLIANAQVFACVKDTECTAPATCHYSTSSPEGQCLDTSQLTVSRTEKAHLTTQLRDRKAGTVCQFTVDCAVDMKCYKTPGSAEGQCSGPPQ